MNEQKYQPWPSHYQQGFNMYLYIAVTVLTAISLNYFLEMQQKLKEIKKKNAALVEKYKPVVDQEIQLDSTKNEYRELQNMYKGKLKKLKDMEEFLKLYDIGVGTTDKSLYETSRKSTKTNLNKATNKLKTVKANIKKLLSEKMACTCSYHGKGIRYGTDGNMSKAQATKLFNREIRLRLRCLDNEFKMAHALMDWHNIGRLIDRCRTTFSEINKSGVYLKTTIQPKYLELKISELKLHFEIEKIKSNIKEEERAELRIQRQAKREEERLKIATERAIKERKKMEILVAREIDKYSSGTKEQKATLEEHRQILETLKKKEARALSMAQKTRAGFVYVVSNNNSFPHGICKIGMTRRLDPYDRVKELGDASVPHLFDIHAFAFSEDAPKLEKILHDEFADSRVNMVNKRKEFFTVGPNKVLDYLTNYGNDIDLQLFGENRVPKS